MSAVLAATAPIDAAALTRRIGRLPALPQAALDVMALLRNEESSAEQCAAAIGRDGAMTAVVLRLANSAFYGVASPWRQKATKSKPSQTGRSSRVQTAAVVSTPASVRRPSRCSASRTEATRPAAP